MSRGQFLSVYKHLDVTQCFARRRGLVLYIKLKQWRRHCRL